MVLIRAVYWDGSQATTKDFQHTQWVAECPDTLLILYIRKPDLTWKEIIGWSAYVLKQRLNDSKYFFGGFNEVTLRALDGDSWSPGVENIIQSIPEVKYGMQISDAQWAIVTSTQWV